MRHGSEFQRDGGLFRIGAGAAIAEIDGAVEVADQLGSRVSKWITGVGNLLNGQDDIAIANIEASMDQFGLASDWVRDLVTVARTRLISPLNGTCSAVSMTTLPTFATVSV